MNDREHLNIPDKANRILNIILISFVLIGLRLWHLGEGQHAEKLQESRLPGRRVEIEPARRGGIRDRYNEPLAINKLKFQAAILYSDLKPIPSIKWEIDSEGKKVKIYKRREYIKQLSLLLAEELKLDASRVEDEIHAKASQFYNIPFILKENITEEEYARLKMMEKDWPALRASRVYERIYPKGKLAGDVIGYLGKIGKNEYEAVIHEREELKLFLEALDKGADLPLPEGHKTIGSIKYRLKELEELAYSAADWVGKTGIESRLEEDLRGFQGKKTIFTDAKGQLLREYPGARERMPGKRIMLSISSELQDYSEKLLALSEETRDTRVKMGTTKIAEKSPWIKGGSVIAMDPHTGEILALASYPRFNPNDFNARKEDKIHLWLEDDISMGAIWNGQLPLSREHYDLNKDRYWDEEVPLTWDFYLDLILSKDGETKAALKNNLTTLDAAVKYLKKTETDPKLSDLLSLAVDERLFSSSLLSKTGKWSLNYHRENEKAACCLYRGIEDTIRHVFSENDFKIWREENEKTFIQEKRALEKAENSYPKPYLDYLDEEERSQFRVFWENNRQALLLTLLTAHESETPYDNVLNTWKKEVEAGAHHSLEWVPHFWTLKKAIELLPKDLRKEYLFTLRSFNDLERPLKFGWRLPKKEGEPLLQKNLAKAFKPVYGWGFGRSHAYRQATIQGSIFKLITAYTALSQKWKKNESLNLLEIDDHYHKVGKTVYVGLTKDSKPIPQLYKGGRVPRSVSSHLGKVDLYGAIELSSNPYFALLASDVIDKPSDLIDAAKMFSYGRRTGIDLPGELAGRLPTDLDTNKTGLFATSIGQHTLVVTPLQTSIMLATIANGGSALKPQIITMKAGKKRGKLYEEIPYSSRYPHKKALYMAGIDFPLVSLPKCQEESLITKIQPKVIEEVFLPLKIKNILLEGMRRVVKRQTKSSLFSLSRIYKDYPGFISDFVDMKNHIVGKTSTSEAIERLDLDKPDEHALYTHVWFGGICFEDQVKAMKFEKPDLIIVVYLRYGGYGNEASPIAAQIAKKWREIKESHASTKH